MLTYAELRQRIAERQAEFGLAPRSLVVLAGERSLDYVVSYLALLADGHVPILAAGAHVRRGVDLGTRATFADVGQTLAELFDVGPLAHGQSFLADILDQIS